MARISGIKLLEERMGEGRPAQKGDSVTYNLKLFLNQEDEVRLNETQAQDLPKHLVRIEGGQTFINHMILLGRRCAILAVGHGPLNSDILSF
jgi:hypothetical protein